MKSWPTIPAPYDYTGWGIEGSWEVPSNTACKHGHGSCEDCGTSDRVDRLHTTLGGVGLVGRLLRK
jgi:predicted transglutaminase-like cysteine proteinase